MKVSSLLCCSTSIRWMRWNSHNDFLMMTAPSTLSLMLSSYFHTCNLLVCHHRKQALWNLVEQTQTLLVRLDRFSRVCHCIVLLLQLVSWMYVAHDFEQSVIVRSVLPHLECGTICLPASSPNRPLPPSNGVWRPFCSHNRSTSDKLLHLLLPVLEA